VEYAEIIDHFRAMAMFEGWCVTEPESPCGDGDTPLHVAAIEGRLDLIKTMLPFVRNIDVRGYIGNTPLHCAACGGHADVAQYLIEHGADPRSENDYGDTPGDFMECQDRDSENSIPVLKAN